MAGNSLGAGIEPKFGCPGMNLLVTNTQNPQSYAIIRALRPYAEKVVATMEGENRLLARLSQAAASRLVDRRYYVPSPVADWWAGNIRRENTDQEEAFVQTLVHICTTEKIDVIFPSWDPYVYVLSKNKALFESMGITIPVPDYEVGLRTMDKYQTIQAANEVGFPCPRTYLYEDQESLQAIVEKEDFPLVIKPRFSSGGRGMAIVKDYPELLEKLQPIIKNHGKPMIQEYIPGRDRVSFPVLLDRNGELRFAYHKRIVRNFRVTARFGTVEESALPDSELLRDAERLLRHLGWWGSVSVGTVRDPRDHQCKLMEVNPRFSRNMWQRTELGVNEPWMSIKIAKHESIESFKEYRVGVLFICPVEDLQLLVLQLLDSLIYKLRATVLRKATLDRLSTPKPIIVQIRSYLRNYFSDQTKIIDPHFRQFFRDPLVSILWWLRFSSWVLGALKHAGR